MKLNRCLTEKYIQNLNGGKMLKNLEKIVTKLRERVFTSLSLKELGCSILRKRGEVTNQ